ncbi:heavy metal translocating P-type ATPase [Aridibaculum aurantiacum]|uniref:heavy metal translocating P-type ATPase n=1 Tax=Aridibaculum aurantiacum TaxID=2810307 RepID=UPI001A9568EA|nr:cation-translocating P-type ATPase [Aridibaculum aurantiacum]
MEKISWKVEGMTCSNCALSVSKVLEKQGMKQIAVNPLNGEVAFENATANGGVDKARKNIELLGYTIVSGEEKTGATAPKSKWLRTTKQKFFFCLPFTLLLMAGHLGMTFGWHFLHNPVLELFLCLPVFIVGMSFFGKSAINSLRTGVPNMNVLITLGAVSAFVYSVIGLLTANPGMMFFETAASIITIVFFGNWLEDVSIQKTQKTVRELTKEQKVMANMIAYDDQHNENIFPVENTALQVGDLILIKSGEQVPTDCKILSGDAEINEAIVSGESLPVYKKQGDTIIGGSVVSNGTLKCYVTATGKDTVRSSIVQMMKQAQGHKPPVQKLADKISAIFVPIVITIALVTLAINYFFVDGVTFQQSLMRSIAVLVIACPCAMGLATPAAIAVGLGRAAREGILYTDSKSMELFRNIQQIVFDKTGTLTNGNFVVTEFESSLPADDFKSLVFSLEKFSNHPIAKSIAQQWKTSKVMKWKKVEEIKGIGMKAEDKDGNIYLIGSPRIDDSVQGAHHLYVKKNDEIVGWIDIADELRPEAKEVIDYCRRANIHTIMLSGDSYAKCKAIAETLGIDEVIAEQTPQQKLEKITQLANEKPTIMVGDGINDAPALAKATISISLSQASQLAIQSASVVLMNSGLTKLPLAVQLGKKTYGTIKSNMFWAFIYNIVAIPIAAVGLLTPTAGALIMGFSDVVLAANSLWLNYKKVE